MAPRRLTNEERIARLERDVDLIQDTLEAIRELPMNLAEQASAIDAAATEARAAAERVETVNGELRTDVRESERRLSEQLRSNKDSLHGRINELVGIFQPMLQQAAGGKVETGRAVKVAIITGIFIVAAAVVTAAAYIVTNVPAK